MGKRQRQKKLAKITEMTQEQLAAKQRRKERLEPMARLLRKFTVTLLVTILLLAVAMIVNSHLDTIAANLMNR